ncbi:MAG: hypothetical protein CFH34_01666 [Alphaproteobacteria bacterium MarineAlpha9_Bin4]|nr:hypothetical protein [Pelagibacterales bacterium]PPR24882.1 MAG: hypothetical protein CFH34_01666 [Alphaproteobacteria bacterium MarineAlpha9_Bin4]
MLFKRLLKNLEKIKKLLVFNLRKNFSDKVIDFLEVLLFLFLFLITVYFIFIAFTEILLILILLILILIYRKL